MHWPKLIATILVCQLAGVIGSVFTISAIPTWYAQLSKPFFAPPNWIFAPVWILLFTLMGISLYWALQARAPQRALLFFGIQWTLNVAWSVLFFGLQHPLSAGIEILLLAIAIAMTIIEFHRVSKPAAWALVPYLVWVCFAAILNWSIWLLNP